MLASLLPGLRDVRIPLTVGYLYLFNAWLWFYDAVPHRRPSGNSTLEQALELVDMVGPASAIAAISFGAYLLGVVLELPLTFRVPEPLRGAAPTLMTRWRFRRLLESADTRETRQEHIKHLGRLNEAFWSRVPAEKQEAIREEFESALGATIDSQRPRLLVANQELYGEFDRLASEAQFRLNVAPPLVILGLTIAASAPDAWLLPSLSLSL